MAIAQNNFISYTIKDGLPQSQVSDICEDQFGYLWFATQGGGLSKFDGKSFTNFAQRDGLISNTVYKVIEDREGNIWAATDKGLSKFDGRSFETIDIYPEDHVNSAHGLFEDSDGNIWFNSPKGGVSVINDSAILHFNEANGFSNGHVSDYKTDAEGNIWISTSQDGLYYFKDGTFRKVDAPVFNGNTIYSLFFDKNNKLYIGSQKGIIIKEGDEFTFLSKHEKLLMPVYSIAQDEGGALWLAVQSGVLRFSENKVREFKQEHGFTNMVISEIHRDREGTLWFATPGEGVYKYQGETFTYIGHQYSIAKELVFSIARDKKNNYWFGTLGGGISKYNGSTFEKITVKDGLSSNNILCSVVDDEGAIWFGTSGGGINKIKGNSIKVFMAEDGLASNFIYTVFKDYQGNLWFGSRKGLIRHNGNEFETISKEISCAGALLQRSDSVILIGSYQGVVQYDGKTFSKFLNDKIFAQEEILALAEDKNQAIWIGSKGTGICKYNFKNNRISYISQSDGLASNLIYSLLFDDEGNLFVGTEKGIDKISFDSNGKISSIRNFNQNEGFLGVETNQNAVFKDSDGSIIFGSVMGAYRYNPEMDIMNSKEPITHLTNVKLFFDEVDWGKYTDSTSQWFNIPQNLVLPHDQNHLIFEFAGSSLKNPDKVRYRYKIKNLDKAWSPVVSSNEALYNNIPPGKYTFMVKASNNDGVWNEEPIILNFEIKPAIWQTWYFYLIVGLFALVILKLLHNYWKNRELGHLLRIEKIKKEETEKIRKKMARDFHDELGNKLASISVSTNILNFKLKEKTPEVSKLIDAIENSSKYLFSGTKDFIWSIDPESDHLNEIFNYVKDFGEEFFGRVNIDFYARNNNPETLGKPLPAGFSRHIVMIFKEAMANILKHAHADAVHLIMEYQEPQFSIILKDNGRGFQQCSMNGNGLRNMKNRAEEISCSLSVCSKPEGGTKIILAGKILSPT